VFHCVFGDFVFSFTTRLINQDNEIKTANRSVTMQKAVVVVCLLVVLPLLAQAGNIGKDEGEGSSKRFDVKGDRPSGLSEIFNIPENMTEEEWHENQYEEFKKNDFNAFQKSQFQNFERMRFQQWQIERFQHLLAEKQKELAKETEKFVFKQKVAMEANQKKHDKWLQSLLGNEKERKKLLKQIMKKERDL